MSGDNLGKLKKCILMLSSEHDGEVLTAARAINRVLAAVGRDWHWLAGRVNSPPELKAHGNPPVFGNHQAAAQWLLDTQGMRLREKDRDFLESMTVWHGEPTERQGIWLADLCKRFGYRP